MASRQTNSAQAASHLLTALESVDPLSHEEARDLLSAYVAAEQAGVDVDAMPEYTDLTRHLEHCEECLTLYSELSADFATMLGEGEPVPSPPLATSLSTVTRQTEDLLLRVFAGLQRRFEATFQLPRLEPSFASLSGSRRAVLLNEQLAEVDGEPAISISVGGEAGSRDLLIAVSDDRSTGRWDVRVTLGEAFYSATTDEQGIAHISGLILDNISQLVIFVAEADPS
jgi:hypothetical protein